MEVKSEGQNQSQIRFDDEIDLLELLAKIVHIIRKRILLLPIFLIVGVALGVSGYFVFKPTFQTKMIASSPIISYPTFAGIISTLNDFAEEGNYEELSNRLNLSLEDVKKIKGFESENIIGKTIDEINSVQNRDLEKKEIEQFIIAAKIADTNIVAKLQVGMINYILNNSYVKNTMEIEIQSLQNQIDKIITERKYVDEMKEEMTNLFKKGDIKDIYANPSTFYQQSVDLYQRQSKLEKELELVKKIQILEPFVIYKKPTSFNISKSVIAGFIGGLFLWIIFLVFLELNKAIKKVKLPEDD